MPQTSIASGGFQPKNTAAIGYSQEGPLAVTESIEQINRDARVSEIGGSLEVASLTIAQEP